MEISEDNPNSNIEEKGRNINTNNIKNEIEIDNSRINNKMNQKIIKANRDKQKYISMVQFYINLNLKTNDYNEITKENADKLFNIINE